MVAKYAYSIKTEQVRERDFPYNGQSLTGTQDLIEFAKKLQDLDVEKMIVVYLDAQNKLMGILPIIGTANQAVVYPREVLRHALLNSASGMILIHNHPSGSLTPSGADIRLTKMISDCAKILDVGLLDHLIMAGGGYFSFRDEGILY